MTLSATERRATPDTLLAETALLRVRITSAGVHGLACDALTDDGTWTPLLQAPTANLLAAVAVNGTRTPARFYSFDPVAIGGEVRGVSLLGTLGAVPVNLLLLLDAAGSWLRVHVTVEGDLPAARLEHSWQLAETFRQATIRWPLTARRAPAALLQADTCCVALLPEEPAMTARTRAGQTPAITAVAPVTATGTLATSSYHLCLDARALPGRGFQQVVRRLGASPAFACMPRGVADASSDPMPALPPVPAGTNAWVPFGTEGPPAALVALAHEGMVRALLGDWSRLDDALCWLDRLILAEPAGTVAAWLPVLLLEAFRLTGIREYAARGATALSLLNPRVRCAVFGALAPTFGDVYLHMDVQEVVALQELDFLHAAFTDDGVVLNLLPRQSTQPLRVVLDGAEPAYTLSVNGQEFGTLTSDQCLAGITI